MLSNFIGEIIQLATYYLYMYTTHHEMCLSLDTVVDSLLCCCLDRSVLVPTALEDGGQEGGEERVRGRGERGTHLTPCHTNITRGMGHSLKEKQASTIEADIRIKIIFIG